MSDTTNNQSIPNSQQITASLDALFEFTNRSDQPGLVVGVALRGKVLYRKGFGLASIEHGVANAPHTRMRIGSTAKHFASVGALLLVEDGLLGLDDGIHKYFPELPMLDGEVTVRQLMNHTSGYRSFVETDVLATGMAIKPVHAPLELLMRQTHANFAPGQKAMYNNSGYHLLALLIEKVSGQPFARFLKERVIDPLGMVDTESVPSDFEIHPNVATLHVPLPDGRWRRGIFPYEGLLAEGALISNVDDMLRWAAHLRNPKLVGSAKSWASLIEPTVLASGVRNAYGFGLIVIPHRGVRTISHAGGVVGGASEMLCAPEHELDIVIMANSGLLNPPALARQVLEAVLGEAAFAPQPEKVRSEQYQPLVGRRYHAPSGYTVSFIEHEGMLGASILNGSPAPMRLDGDVLRMGDYEDGAGGPVAISGARDAQGEQAPTTLVVSEGGVEETLRLLPDAAPAPAAAAEGFVGRYESPDLAAKATVTLDDGVLTLRVVGIYGATTMVLEPYSDQVIGFAIASEIPSSGVLTLDRVQGEVQSFRANDGRTRHVLFTRLPG